MIQAAGPSGTVMVFQPWSEKDLKEAMTHLPQPKDSGENFATDLEVFCQEFSPTMQELKCLLMLKLGISQQVKDALPKPAEGVLHDIRPGDFVVIKDFRRKHWKSRRCNGPFQVLLITHTAVKVAERAMWCRPSDDSKETDSTHQCRGTGASWNEHIVVERQTFVHPNSALLLPEENRKLWNGAEKFLDAMIPAHGVSLLQIEVEITRYELISFMNTTKVMVEGINEELRGLRWTALQYRLGD
ncbi:hypothetical protein QQF64_006592 [Cirrhinus molitorella]|uniref:Uncharacterized protein n=1 Tax=Cirrhinus molitorella TaxID=172907 RepID=A0ABR3MBR6_9TELE